MSKFSQQHYKVVAEVIKDWLKLNSGMQTKHVDSLINGFIITFKADNNEFDRYKFGNALVLDPIHIDQLMKRGT